MAVKALYSFSKHTGWADVSKFLEDELQAIYKALAESPSESTLRQLQGRAQFLQEFLTMVRDAPKVLEKLRESTL